MAVPVASAVRAAIGAWFVTVLPAAMLAAAPAQAAESASASLSAPDGRALGEVRLTDTPHGVLLDADLRGLPPGPHAFHIHAVGACTPDFGAAGGHYDPFTRAHGLLDPEGQHAGDLPNIHVGDDGRVRVETLAYQVRLREGFQNTLLDDDGSAIVIHAGADDYRSNPAGASGERIACGAVRP